MADHFLSSSLQLTATSPILFFTTVKTPVIHNHRTTCTAPTNPRFHLLRRSAAAGTAVADQTEGGRGGEVLLNPEDEKRVEVADYDWREEWYPLYLTRNVPEDAPLGLTVFDRQIVLYRDGEGTLRCYEDRCPHRLAKLSEGQLIDGRLECLYHGWQFEGDGKCVKIPQLPASAKIPKAACVKTYEVKDSQGVVWVWMSTKTPPNPEKLPWFEHFARPGFFDISTTHELPYDHSILLENLMDPAHVPISHDRTDFSSKREDAQPLVFEVTERTNRGFAGTWGKEKDGGKGSNLLRFDAPCVLQNNREFDGKDGVKNYFSGLFLCRPTGQGKSMLIVRFGVTKRSPLVSVLPQWFSHQNACKVFEQDMGFLSSQNEVLMKEKVPTKDLYLNLKSSDTWVAEYRKWMDKVGHGMPYHFGHRTISLPKVPPVVEHAPAGLIAALSASYPAKGGIGTMHAPNLANRYFRHIIHCRSCTKAIKSFELWKNILSATAIALTTLAILVVSRQWKAVLLGSAALLSTAAYGCLRAIELNTNNFIRTHRRL
ncbi:PREDICTED: protein TIC 55, chloroplastic [Camelina sativa]|uniref:Protein TIC 55, chloroplastic n=1 Tax=Camelina sativa TaxID=90675 RepID=A0ABM0SWR8_CAMSA|nr:PREDICTED: protein TIC 55, chloroplastic [Camelina sativa]